MAKQRRGITYELTGKEAGVIDSFRKAVGASRQMEVQHGKTGKAATRSFRKAERGLAKFTRTAQTSRSRAFRLLGGGFLASTGTRAVLQEASNQARLASDFEKEISGLLSLGDNTKNIPQVKSDILSLSSALGKGRSDVADFFFRLQSGAANLSDEIKRGLKKESIELVEVTGDDLPVALQVLVKGWQIYGETLKDVNQLQNKLFFTAEQGNTTFQELGTLLPDILPSAKALGFSLDEVLGALVTATQVGGKSEKTFTGLRNVFSRLNKAEAEGIKLTGRFADQLQQLSEVDPLVLKKIFGDEAFSTAAALAEKSAEVRANIEAIAKLQGDLTRDRLRTRLEDPSFLSTRIRDLAAAGAENASLRGGGNKDIRSFNTQLALSKRGVSELFGVGPGVIQSGIAIIDTLKEFVISGQRKRLGIQPKDKGTLSDLQSLGLAGIRGDLLDSGLVDQADAISKFRRDRFDPRTSIFNEVVETTPLFGEGTKGERFDRFLQALVAKVDFKRIDDATVRFERGVDKLFDILSPILDPGGLTQRKFARSGVPLIANNEVE